MEAERYSRRTFLNRIWALVGSLAVLEIIALVVAFFRPRQPRNATVSEDSIVVAGSVEEFEPGSVTAFVRGGFYLSRLEDGGFLALSRRCTHLSCTVPWVENEALFVCPCHSSAFDIRGNVIAPPAPRALDLHPMAIENGVIRVDTSRLYKRAAYAPEQATYPEPA
jgi:cytochrome b6-f complex iron-sulfur subunit